MSICQCGCGQECKNKYIFGHYWSGKKHSEESIQRMKIKKLGKKHCEETKNKLKQIIPWNKGLTKDVDERVKHSEESKIKISDSLKGIKFSEEHCRKLSESTKGKEKPYYRKEGNPNWKGGKSFIYTKLYTSTEYGIWRTFIFKRDKFTCYLCKKQSQKLNAHHILKASDWPEYLLQKWNGITLCKKCHIKTYSKEYSFVLQFLPYTTTFEEITDVN